METIVERPAALDVHKAQVTACVRVPNQSGEREERIAEFSTTVRGLLALRDWRGYPKTSRCRPARCSAEGVRPVRRSS